MTNDEKAKAYDMALEAARKELGVDRKEWEVVQRVLHNIFPELRESEDERIRKELINFLRSPFIKENLTDEKVAPWIAWLEKQKENPKNAISIPADCVSDAKCEDRWHKTANSLPDDGRDVLAKDALGNYLLASFDGAQWFVSVYDGQDHPVLHTPPILEWCDIETCEESLHISETCKENANSFTSEQKEQKPAEKQDYSGLNDLERAILRGFLCAGVENVPVTIIKETAQDCLAHMPAEWSEEDEKMIDAVIDIVSGSFYEPLCPRKEMLAWLRSLRPCPSWKPSEVQMKALQNAVALTACDKELARLYNQLKKL